MSELRSRPAWRALEKHYEERRDLHLRDLFAEDPERGERLVAEGAGLYFDYSKNRVPDETIAGEVMSAGEPELAHDSSTTALIRCYRTSRNGRES